MDELAALAGVTKGHLRRVVKAELKGAASVKEVRTKVEVALDLSPGTLKPRRKTFEALVTAVINMEDAAPPPKARQRKEATEAKRAKRAKVAKRAKEAKAAAPKVAAEESWQMKQVKAFASAARLGPTFFKGTKEMSEAEKLATLLQRIREKGISVSGKGGVPSARDIAQAKRKREREDDLDGIDTSLIIDHVRRRRPAALASAAASDSAGSSSDAADSGDDDSDAEHEAGARGRAEDTFVGDVESDED